MTSLVLTRFKDKNTRASSDVDSILKNKNRTLKGLMTLLVLFRVDAKNTERL